MVDFAQKAIIGIRDTVFFINFARGSYISIALADRLKHMTVSAKEHWQLNLKSTIEINHFNKKIPNRQ